MLVKRVEGDNNTPISSDSGQALFLENTRSSAIQSISSSLLRYLVVQPTSPIIESTFTACPIGFEEKVLHPKTQVCMRPNVVSPAHIVQTERLAVKVDQVDASVSVSIMINDVEWVVWRFAVS